VPPKKICVQSISASFVPRNIRHNVTANRRESVEYGTASNIMERDIKCCKCICKCPWYSIGWKNYHPHFKYKESNPGPPTC
jgi:hypothetical protein